MDRIARYREIILKTLQEYAAIPYSYGDLERKLKVCVSFP